MVEKSIIGVDMGGTMVRAGLVENARVVDISTSEIPAAEGKERVLERVVEAIERIFRPSVVGIGVGVPSLVDVEGGIVYNVQNIPSWREVPLKKILERRFGRPIYVNNDANCFAVGERHFGKGRQYRTFVGLTIGTGMGAGIIIDGRLYTGAHCGAGEFGSIPYRDSVLESYSSGQFFSRKYGVRGSELYQRANEGDNRARAIFREFGSHLAEALMIIMLAVDPQAIILGGSVALAYPYFEETMRDRMKLFPYPHAVEKLAIETSEEPHIAILGAAALFLEARIEMKNEVS